MISDLLILLSGFFFIIIICSYWISLEQNAFHFNFIEITWRKDKKKGTTPLEAVCILTFIRLKCIDFSTNNPFDDIVP